MDQSPREQQPPPNPPHELAILLPEIRRIAANLEMQAAAQKETHSELRGFVRNLLLHLQGKETFYEIEKAIFEALARYPRIVQSAESSEQRASIEFAKMVSAFVLATFAASLPSSEPCENTGVSFDESLIRTEELLLATISSALAEEPVSAPKSAVSSRSTSSHERESAPQAAPGYRGKSDADDFMQQVVRVKGKKVQSRGFQATEKRTVFGWCAALPLIVVGSLENIGYKCRRMFASSRLVNSVVISAVLLSASFMLGSIGVAHFWNKGAARVALQVPQEKEDLRLAPEVVIPKDWRGNVRALETLHGFGEHGRNVEVLIDGEPSGSASIESDWTWSLKLARPLLAGTHRIQVTYAKGSVLKDANGSGLPFTEKTVTVVTSNTLE
jgi:hypothetical protein